MAFIGYARVSTAEQNLALQTDALHKAGCTRIFEDTVSGAKAERAGLSAALAYVREGDTLVVWRLCHFQKTTAPNVRRQLHFSTSPDF